ncbi:MAG: PAS domain S-box protein [Deltaproteobacteria bacterium]|nr:PAS domain S-box protein [Deltaproteobacteria bacterium]
MIESKSSGKHASFRKIARELQLSKEECRKLREALRESEEKFQAFTEESPNMIFINKAGRIVYANKTCERRMGYEKSEFIDPNFDFRCLIAPESAEIVSENFKRHMKGDEIGPYEYTLITKKGERIDAIITSRLIQYEGERALLGIVTDITERKRAEEALRESEEKYRLLVENAKEAIFVLQDERICFYNSKAAEMGRRLGVNFEKSFLEYIYPEDRKLVKERHLQRLEGRPVPPEYTFRLIGQGGEVYWVNLNAVCINWQGRPATLNFMRDITAQKELESRLLQSQKLEALGNLAGGIAHDFNNLLMAIQGNASLMALDIPDDHMHQEFLKNIEKCVKSGSELTQQLLGFARGGKYHAKPTDLNELVRRNLQMFVRTKKEVHVHSRFQEDLWNVEIDRGQITQVLLNILLNAWQAMPGGGDLFVETRNMYLSEPDSIALDISRGRYVRISIRDTGTGMDEETLKRIFEPFFTTKERGRGTGLGLASAYGIIKNHGGGIGVSSKLRQGTIFDIYLPASERKPKKEKPKREDLFKGKEGLLFVDDEDLILVIGVKILEGLGYKVYAAKSGAEAIEIYRAKGNQIDLVILDIIMPGMGGLETYEQLKMIDPGVKVLLSSGYSVADQASEILQRGADGFIQKPYRINSLSRKIREILEQ